MNLKDFSIDDVLKFGWQVMKGNFWFFVGVFLLAGFLPRLIGMIPIPLVNVIASMALSVVMHIGMIRIAISYCDQVQPTMGELFQPKNCFWRFLATYILYSLIIFGGLLLFLIPGIIWSIKYCYALYFVVDKGLKPTDALRASGIATQGMKLKLFGFGILCSLINLLGLLCLFVGIFATAPTIFIANALVYRHLLAQTPELAQFGIAPIYSSAAIPMAIPLPVEDQAPPTPPPTAPSGPTGT